MKGIIFTRFLELVEQHYGYEMVDAIIEQSNLPSGGSYTVIGTYDHQEMLSLLNKLSEATNLPINNLLRLYGNELFKTLMEGYQQHLLHIRSAIELLEAIENHIHLEVRKLYPDAELPYFETQRLSDHQMRLQYNSERKMWAFAWGLMEGCFAHFNEEADIQCRLLQADGSSAEFIITKSTKL